MAETGIGVFRFGIKAIKNGKPVERLRSGGRVCPVAENEVRKFIANACAEKQKGRAA